MFVYDIRYHIRYIRYHISWGSLAKSLNFLLWIFIPPKKLTFDLRHFLFVKAFFYSERIIVALKPFHEGSLHGVYCLQRIIAFKIQRTTGVNICITSSSVWMPGDDIHSCTHCTEEIECSVGWTLQWLDLQTLLYNIAVTGAMAWAVSKQGSSDAPGWSPTRFTNRCILKMLATKLALYDNAVLKGTYKPVAQSRSMLTKLSLDITAISTRMANPSQDVNLARDELVVALNGRNRSLLQGPPSAAAAPEGVPKCSSHASLLMENEEFVRWHALR